LTLPWPPTTNNLYANVRGHRVKSARGRAYADAVGVLVGQQAKPWVLKPPYRLTITLHAPGGTGRYDVANREKALCDSIFAAIGQDDSLIDDLRLVRGPVDRVNPRAVVVVEEVA
jgi:Holliday junction resolvase RusA-like endonuclease